MPAEHDKRAREVVRISHSPTDLQAAVETRRSPPIDWLLLKDHGIGCRGILIS